MTLRRQSKRFLDGDCPSGVLAIYDDPHFYDRYTVFFVPEPDQDYVVYLGMSEDPTHPLGFGQHGELSIPQARDFRQARKSCACKWTDLPSKVQILVKGECDV